MKNFNYEISKIENELNEAIKQKNIYLENLERNKVSKKNMILNPVLPVICGIIAEIIGIIICKGIIPNGLTNLIGIVIVSMEAIIFEEEIYQIIEYKKSKKVLDSTSLEEIELAIEMKEKEKKELLAQEKRLCDSKTDICLTEMSSIEKENSIFSENINLDDKEDAKVLFKKFNEGSKK